MEWETLAVSSVQQPAFRKDLHERRQGRGPARSTKRCVCRPKVFSPHGGQQACCIVSCVCSNNVPWVKNRVPKHVMHVFVDMWLTHYGVPEIVMVDQGGEFESTFAQECEEFGIDIRVTGSHAGWQTRIGGKALAC